MKSDKKSKFWLMTGLIVAVLSLLLSYPVSWWADYKTHLNQFSYSVKNYDRDEAQKGLVILKEDYNHFVKWKLQYPADRFLFNRMHLYEAGVSVLNEDFEKVEKDDLKNHEGWEVSYILGVSKFWALHAAFQEAMAKKDKAKMNLILGIVLEQVRSDFEKCVKDGPGPIENFSCSFNYDMTSNPNAAAKALVNPKPKIRYMLNPDGDSPGSDKNKAPKPKKSPDPGPDSGKEAGQGGARKVG